LVSLYSSDFILDQYLFEMVTISNYNYQFILFHSSENETLLNWYAVFYSLTCYYATFRQYSSSSRNTTVLGNFRCYVMLSNCSNYPPELQRTEYLLRKIMQSRRSLTGILKTSKKRQIINNNSKVKITAYIQFHILKMKIDKEWQLKKILLKIENKILFL